MVVATKPAFHLGRSVGRGQEGGLATKAGLVERTEHVEAGVEEGQEAAGSHNEAV